MAFLHETKQETAEEILKKAIELLKDDFPILIYAINLLQPKPVKDKCVNLSTDGESLFYSPKEVVKNFSKLGYTWIKYELLHVLMHCLLGHLEMDGLYKDRGLLWSVMDYEVGMILRELPQADIYINALEYLEKELKGKRGMEIYYHGRRNTRLRLMLLNNRKELNIDDHKFWNPKKAPKKKETGGTNTGGNSEKDKERKKKLQEQWATARSVLGEHIQNGEEMAAALKKCGKKDKSYGLGSDGHNELVTAASENQNSYYQMLMSFLKMKEENREIPDEIDKMLYQYGLDLYGNVPLVEPLETEERLNLNTICVAFDSSGSCSGETANQFLRETYNILRDIKQISKGCELYFFVCDYELQQEKHYESLGELDLKEWEEMNLRGWGGTSFEPVFQRIRKLEEEEEKIIDCLIYLTDSYGDCDTQETDYPVFFVLPSDQVKEDGSLEYYQNLPEWIQYIGLEKEDVR